MAKIVTHFADRGMTNLVIIPVMKMVPKFAWMGGKKTLITPREITAPKLYAALDAITNTDSVTVLDSANVEMDGKVLHVLNVSDIQDVNMVLAMSLTLAIAKKAGVAFFVTKT